MGDGSRETVAMVVAGNAAVARVDGRAARSARTRGAIVEAHLALLRDGDLRPTGERIADRAGVSLRTLWTSFKDMEALYAAAGDRLLELQAEVYRPVPPDLPLAQRVDAFCRQRARLLELLAPAARASVTREPFSAQLRLNRTSVITLVRGEIATLFQPELEVAGPDRPELMNALVMASTFGAWSALRDQLDLPVPQALGVMTRTIRGLLGLKA